MAAPGLGQHCCSAGQIPDYTLQPEGDLKGTNVGDATSLPNPSPSILGILGRVLSSLVSPPLARLCQPPMDRTLPSPRLTQPFPPQAPLSGSQVGKKGGAGRRIGGRSTWSLKRSQAFCRPQDRAVADSTPGILRPGGCGGSFSQCP